MFLTYLKYTLYDHSAMDWETYAWLKRGKRRKATLHLLKDSERPLSTNEVKARLKVALPQASFTLSELRSKGLVECLNPKDKIGKLYRITKSGDVLLEV